MPCTTEKAQVEKVRLATQPPVDLQQHSMSLTLLFSSLTPSTCACAAPTVPGSWTKVKAPHTVPNSYYKAGARAVIEPRTSRTLSENHATRPNSQLIEDANDPKNSLHASDTAPHAAAERVGRAELPKRHTSTKPSP